MAWEDFGIIFPVNNLSDWATSHCYVPTAIQLKDRIRVYAAFWDKNKYGRLGYVDVATLNPTEIIGYSKSPILNDSQPGMFDCDGVTPLTAIVVGDGIRMYYAGWQKFDLPDKRYTIFTGLATSDLSGSRFERYSDTSIMGPQTERDLVRTGCMILKDNREWRNWFASFNKVISINGKSTPSYTLSTMSSEDGISWNNPETCVFPIVENKIMGYGRSAIWKQEGIYHGLFPVREWSGKYINICYSTSSDGINWNPLTLNGMAFTPEHTCDNQTELSFPTIIKQKDRILMFYNGNDFGIEGLRLAIWD